MEIQPDYQQSRWTAETYWLAVAVGLIHILVNLPRFIQLIYTEGIPSVLGAATGLLLGGVVYGFIVGYGIAIFVDAAKRKRGDEDTAA